jgi:hypothetical protein
MLLPPEFRVTETDGTLRVEWDNRAIELKKDGPGVWFSVVWWIVWASATVWITGLLIRTIVNFGGREADYFGLFFYPCWLVFGWVGTLLVPYQLASRGWRESVEITNHALTHTRTGRFAPKPRVYLLDRLAAIEFKWCENDDSPLGIRIVTTGRRATLLGEWLQFEHSFQLFQVIQRFLVAHDVPVKTTVYSKPA